MKRRLVLALMMAAALGGCPKEEESESVPTPVMEPPSAAPAPEPQAPERPKRNFDPEIVQQVKEYFNTKSKLAGKVTMTEIIDLRMDVATETCKVAHVQFAFEEVKSGRRAPGAEGRTRHARFAQGDERLSRSWLQALGGTDVPPAALAAEPGWAGSAWLAPDSGGEVRWATYEEEKGPSESRTFEYNKDAKGWRIRSMGEKDSASFGADLEGWSDPQAVEDIIKYYDAKGVWSGRFRLGKVVRYRVDRITSTTKLAYIKYLYIPLPGNPRETGYDKRTYRFEKRGPQWEVTWMGGYMSALEGLKR